MKPRLSIYLSQYSSADRQLYEFATNIPARRRNNVIKELLLEAFVSRQKRTKSNTAHVPTTHDPSLDDLPESDSLEPSSTSKASSDETPTPNPLDTLQRALDNIPLKPKREG